MDGDEGNTKARNLTSNILLSVVFLFLILIVVVSTLVIYFRIVPTDFLVESTEPSLVLDNTLTELKVLPKPKKSFENFYSEVNPSSKGSGIDFKVLSPEVSAPFSLESSYYNYCKTRKVDIDFTKSKKSNFSFNYLDKKITYEVELYYDLYRFTDTLKSQDCYFTNGQFVMGFLQDPYNQNFMTKVSDDFLTLRENYSNDEIAEIASVFVQSIDYETDVTELNRFPYETIYEERGNCLDKSVILADILKELGYSTYIVLGYLNEYHAVVGVGCEKGNLQYGDEEICLIETTKFAPIGEFVNLTDIKVVKISDGDLVYRGVNYGPQLVREIGNSKERAKQLEMQIDLNSEELVNIQKKMCNTDCVICSNGLVDFERSNLEIDSCRDADEYNGYRDEFLGVVDEYNNNIQEWYEIFYGLESKMFGNVEFVKRG